jgi:diguanylate cyclase (GGDEF)-like protein/PAS domain S-box-containing protein
VDDEGANGERAEPGQAMPASRGDTDLVALMLSRVGVGIITTDHEGRVQYLSPFAERLTGWTAIEARNKPLDRIFRLGQEGGTLPGEPPAPGLSGEHTGPADVEESLLIARDGQRFAIEHSAAPLRAEQGRISGTIIVFNDVSRRNLAALQLARHATFDPLTGLLNRHAFAANVERAIREAGRPGQVFTLCHLDLDQFTLINNTCGHDAGDDLLQWVAALLREETSQEDAVGRFSGDVFAVLLRRGSLTECRTAAESLLRRLHGFQFTWEDKSFPVGACIGLIPVDEPGFSVQALLAAAENACARAKQAGRDHIHIDQMGSEEFAARQRELEWVARIRRNLDGRHVALFAQPILPLDGRPGESVFFEVLLRLRTDDGGYRSAFNVIQTAERYGLMGIVDRWVIRRTLEALAGRFKHGLSRPLQCALNISGVSLHDRSILDFIHEQLARTRVPPATVCFELTETAAVENLTQARWLIQELLAIGCRFALDDFGSGLTSYTHLKDLPVSYLKIAGTFVENIAASELDVAMVRSINQIARVLGVETIAESVSSDAVLGVVRDIGVDWAQGNLLAPPRPLGELLTAAASPLTTTS